ncbi:unnamed protein product [Laminaria digitata]
MSHVLFCRQAARRLYGRGGEGQVGVGIGRIAAGKNGNNARLLAPSCVFFWPPLVRHSIFDVDWCRRRVLCCSCLCPHWERWGGGYIHYDICVFSIILLLLVFFPLLPPLPLVLHTFSTQGTLLCIVRCTLILTRCSLALHTFSVFCFVWSGNSKMRAFIKGFPGTESIYKRY